MLPGPRRCKPARGCNRACVTGTLLTWRPDWAGQQFLLRRPRAETTAALRVPSTPALGGAPGVLPRRPPQVCSPGVLPRRAPQRPPQACSPGFGQPHHLSVKAVPETLTGGNREGGSGLESGSEQSLCGEGSGVTTSPAFHWGPQIPVGKGAGETTSPAQDPRTTKPSVVSEVVETRTLNT